MPPAAPHPRLVVWTLRATTTAALTPVHGAHTDAAARARILLVIADQDLADSLQNMLTGAGYAAPRASSAEEALGMLTSAPMDLVLISLLLPDSDGLMLCSTLKRRTPASIVMLGNRLNGVDRAIALEAGAVDCFSEPVQSDEFLARVASLLRRSPGVLRR